MNSAFDRLLHAKQVDRCLSNGKLDLQTLFRGLVPFVVGELHAIFATIDWTEFDKDDHTTLCISHATPNGRAMPLLWKTVRKSEDRPTTNDFPTADQNRTPPLSMIAWTYSSSTWHVAGP